MKKIKEPLDIDQEDLSRTVSLQSIAFVLKAAKEGNMLAQLNLAACYFAGINLPKDESKAFFWYKQAAKQGLAKAQYNLAACYDKGLGTEKHETNAAYWYQEAATQGHSMAQYYLAICYDKGVGAPKLEGQAVYWYQQAAQQGVAKAQCNLGVCYEYGIGIVEDKKEAIFWYQKAAEQNSAKAQCNLGHCYRKGVGIPKNEKQAVYWYTKAVQNGYNEAQTRLDELCTRLPQLQKIQNLTYKNPELSQVQVFTVSKKIVGKFLAFGWHYLPKNLCPIIVGYLSGIDEKDCPSDLLRGSLAQEYSQQLQSELKFSYVKWYRSRRNKKRAKYLIAECEQLEPSLISLNSISRMTMLLQLPVNKKPPHKQYTQICGKFFRLFQDLADIGSNQSDTYLNQKNTETTRIFIRPQPKSYSTRT